ncbi:MAG: efflux RND transporter periplasmic adaptor subunit [Betaproteobacteria bacterium]|nr:efflux RND transporter periplasmic adaptor subunit [Betaproteobacteria bacterium]
MKIITKGRVVFLVVVVALGGLIWGGVVLQKKMGEGSDKPRYKLADVDRGSIVQFVTATGTLNPVGLVNVGTQVSGTVSEINVDFNDRVRRGQILLKIEPTLLQAVIKQNEAGLNAARAQLTLAESNFNRNTKLVAQGFISATTLDGYRQALDAAKAQVQVSEAQLERARADLDNSIIRSPIDGVIIKRTADLGQTVAASFQTPNLFVIAADLKRMQIDTNVSEADVGLLKTGQTVRFIVDAFPDRDFDGKVRQFRLAANITQNVVTYNVVIDVDNPEELLKPGLTAQVRIITANRPDAMRVPTAALRYRPSDLEVAMDAMKKKMLGAKDGKDAKDGRDAKKDDKPVDDNVDELGLRSKTGERLYRIYRLPEPKPEEKGAQSQAEPVDVVIGVSNSKYTEIVKGPLKAGDKVVVRSLLTEPGK